MENTKNQVEVKDVKNAVQTVKMDKDIADSIFNRVNQMEESRQLMFPDNYAVGNALKSAYLIIQNTKDKEGRPALQVCDKLSVANTLLDMVLQGLNPVKKQCYFIVYGNQLQLFVSYFGHQTAVKFAVPAVEDIYAEVIHQDDVFEIGSVNGKKVVKKHEIKFENLDKPIIGAYSVITKNGVADYEIMTMKEIQTAWSHAKTDKVQKEFPQEMAKRTVLNRHCKRYINTSDDSAVMTAVEAYNRTIDKENTFDEPSTQLELQTEVDNNANQKPLVIEVQAEESKPETEPTNSPEF